MKALFSVVLFFTFLAFQELSHANDGKSCGAPPLSKNQLIDIYAKEISYKRDVDIENIKKGSDFTVQEERCSYLITRDKPLQTGERPFLKVDRKGEAIFIYFEKYDLSNRAKDQICSEPPLSGDQLIDIYVNEIHRKNGVPIEKIREGLFYTIWDEGCIYGMGSNRSSVLGDGPYARINRKGEVLIFHPMP